MKKIYKKTISKSSYIWLTIVIILSIAMSYNNLTNHQYLGFSFLCLAISCSWYFTFIHTKYYIDDTKIIIKALFEKKEISIEKIKQIEKNQTKNFLSFLIPAETGLLIHYNKYDEVLISPKINEIFIKELKNINPNIEIVE